MSMFSTLVKSVTTLVQTVGTTNFPYTIGEEIFEWKQCIDNNERDIVWKLLEGTKIGTGEKVTIFALENRKTVRQNRVDAALNCLNELKRIRHPHILSYRDELITDDKILFVSEYVYPLTACLHNIGNAHKMNESFIALGLFQMASALSFVHNDLNMCHCLVSPSSIFINKAGDYKLGNLFLAHSHKNVPSHLLSNFDLLPTKYRPKELSANKNTDTINILISNPIHSIDAWCVGCTIFELFNHNNIKFTKPQQLSNLSSIPHSLHSFYKRLLATKPSSRMAPSSLLECDWIQQNALVKTSKFLSEIAIKSDKEKRQFLQHLDDNIESYPSSICRHKILPALTHLLQHGFGSNPVILSCVLKISHDTDVADDIEIRPLIINMFKNNERGTRINLLKSLPKIMNYLDSECVSSDIWPQLINGFTDSSPVLREQSVRSVIHFAPKLKQDIMANALLPLLDKLASNDVEPAIRTNICIVLGKIAQFANLHNNVKNEELLVKCFARALNDAFTPCRNAALCSFAASIGLFSPKTIANRILPNIIKYCCDPYQSVRDSSFKCVEIGLLKLKQHALTLSDKEKEKETETSTEKEKETHSSSYLGLGNVTSYFYDKTTKQSNQSVPNNALSHDASHLDDLFASNDMNNKNSNTDDDLNKQDKMVLKQVNKEQQKPDQSLDDFLASFNDDLNQVNQDKSDLKDLTPKSKIKYKNKNKKKHKKSSSKKKSKSKALKAATTKQDTDDFFDDW